MDFNNTVINTVMMADMDPKHFESLLEAIVVVGFAAVAAGGMALSGWLVLKAFEWASGYFRK